MSYKNNVYKKARKMKNELAMAFGGMIVGISLAILILCIIFGLTSPETVISYADCVIKSRN
ncbi:hypothetical protein GBM01_10365 [Yersinia pseudotuberculosis]|nr:hypothetical protein [Yersinia pseudotuberculosis]MBO1561717.1 hypothetical protein [Yersinia pseudotuberculosis]